jgi:hypothetical protein
MTYNQMRLLIASFTLLLTLFLLCDRYVKPVRILELYDKDSVYNRGLARSVDEWYLVGKSGETIWTGRDPIAMKPGDPFVLNRSWLLKKQLSLDYRDFEFSHGASVHHSLSTFRDGPLMPIACVILLVLSLLNLRNRPITKNDNINDRLLFGPMMTAIGVCIFYLI